MSGPETDAAGALQPARPAGGGPGSSRFPTGGQWVLHVPFDATNDEDAIRLASLALSLLDEAVAFDRVAAEVSREDHQSYRRRVYCNRRLHNGRRCDLPPEHRPPCSHEEELEISRRRPNERLDGTTWR